jgi:DNA polymerase III epsilon subunit-like protein
MKGGLVFFDLETGGLRWKDPDIQLAAVAVREWREVDAFERKIRFDEDPHDAKQVRALEINSYDRGVWAAEAVDEGDVVKEFAEFLRPFACVTMVSNRTGNPYSVARLAGHNAAGFDGGRIANMFKRHDRFMPAAFQVLDTLQLALWHFEGWDAVPPENFKLATLCRHFGIDIPEGVHDALVDARLSAALARRIVNGP